MSLEDRIEERMEYWEEKDLRPLKSRNTKVFQKTMEHVGWTITGEMVYQNQKISDKEFRLAVDRFSTSANDINYLPVKKKPLKETYLKDFIYNPWGRFTKQLLVFTLQNEPQPIIKPKYPGFLNHITRLYLEEIQMDETFLKQRDKERLTLVSHKLGNFRKTMNGTLVSGPGVNLPNLFLQHAKTITGGNTEKLTTKFLTFNWVWEKFPHFLVNNGFIERRKNRIEITR